MPCLKLGGAVHGSLVQVGAVSRRHVRAVLERLSSEFERGITALLGKAVYHCILLLQKQYRRHL